MEKFIEIINDDYQEILRGFNQKYHLFFNNTVWWKNMVSWYIQYNESRLKNKYKLEYAPNTNLNIKETKCEYKIRKILRRESIKKIYQLISNKNIKDFSIIKKALYKMYDYNLPSTIDNLNKWKQYDDKNSINVMIVGAGPLGLYTALYLNQYYNRNMIQINNRNIFNLKVNILVIDNRIYKEGVKKPYSRVTQFWFNILEIQPFINQIFCWKGMTNKYDKQNHFDYINILENLLYITAFEEKIPMYFTKKFEDFNTIKKFIKKESIHYVFDCTGGRLKNTPTDMLKWNKYKFIKGNQEIKFNNESKYFEVYENNKSFSTTIILLEIFDKKMKQILVGNYFGYLTDTSDNTILNKYKNKYFLKKDYISLSKNFKSNTIRNLLPYIINVVKIPNNKIIFVKLTSYDGMARHAPFAATSITNKSTYIKLGDSLATTQWGIYVGMKTSMLFSRHICNMISSVKHF